MIISRTPLRISFVGGGSDIQSYYRLNTGAVISTAINKYIYITVNKKFDNKIRASYSKTEIVDSIDQVQHPLIRECLKMTEIDSGIEVTSMSDIPSEGTGLGSSSSYTVGLLNALYAYKGRHVSAEQLAQEACKIEIDILKNPIGKQDQYIAAYGGIQHIQFNPDESVYVDPIICSFETKSKLENNMLILYTGLTRSAYTILSKQGSSMKTNKKALATMTQMVELTKKMRIDLNENKLDKIGEVIEENWLLKKTLTENISSQQIDLWYHTAKNHGATGGKILGAGGGGFLLLYADPKDYARILESLPELVPMSFKFEPQGSKIIFVEKT